MADKARKHGSVTIKDVAREAGVSYSTVSRVVNDYQHVREDKRRRVIAAMERLGYSVNLQARSLVRGRSQVIGLVVHDLGNPYTAQIVQSVDDALSVAGYDLVIHTTHRHLAKEPRYVNTLTHGLIDGLLLLIPLRAGHYLRQLRERQFPYVVIADYQDFDDFSPMVGINNWSGAYAAVQYLLELGHQRIGFLMGLTEFNSAGERFEAYKAALADYGIPLQPELVCHGDYQYRASYQSTLSFLDLPQPPTAIFATNDMSALGVYDAVRRHSLRIPDDISIMGFDDIPQAAYLHPALTTVRQPLAEMGRLAAQMLLKYIDEPTRPTERVVLETELIVRESCQPPPRRTGALTSHSSR